MLRSGLKGQDKYQRPMHDKEDLWFNTDKGWPFFSSQGKEKQIEWLALYKTIANNRFKV